MHLACLKAAIELANIKGDIEFAQECEKWFTTAQHTLIDHLWTGNYFRNWWNNNEKKNNALHVDTQYGQLWSYLLGLGDLIKPEMLRSHLQMEEKIADSPYGLQVLAFANKDRDVTGTNVNNTVWQIGSIDWTILNLYLGTDAKRSLAQAEKLIKHWSEKLNDQWNYTDLTYVSDGYPHTNSHYGRQLMFWGIPIALSGQDYSAIDQKLCFNPKIKAPYKLPFYLPQANGVLIADNNGKLHIELLSGNLNLKALVINNNTITKEITLRAGESLKLNTKSK